MQQLQQIISINNNDSIFKVSARDLHKFLESKQDFSTWIKDRIYQYGFEEGNDYIVFQDLKGNQKGGRIPVEYILTIDTAKELSMVERTEKGKQARRYFIAVENEARKLFESSNLLKLVMSNAPIEEQIQNSKDVNRIIQEKYNSDYLGINAKITKGVSGKFPSEWKEEAKKQGIPSKDRQSGKSAIRKLSPDKAIAISTADECIGLGWSIDDSIEMGILSIPASKKIVEMNRRYLKN